MFYINFKFEIVVNFKKIWIVDYYKIAIHKHKDLGIPSILSSSQSSDNITSSKENEQNNGKEKIKIQDI